MNRHRKLLKVFSMILAILTCGTLFIPLISGHKLTDTTLVWIKITGWDLIWFDPLMVFAFLVPMFGVAVMLHKYPIAIKKMMLISTITVLASTIYTFSLVEAWNELWTNVSQEIHLWPVCVLYPVFLGMQMLAIILSVYLDWTESRKETWIEW